jgi:hypothetical protein
MREQRAKLSRRNDIAKAMDYMLKRWNAFTRFFDDGRICLSNTPPSEPCAASLWAESPGCSVAPIAATTVLR